VANAVPSQTRVEISKKKKAPMSIDAFSWSC